MSYIDPGAGHYLIQMLGVICFGALFYVKECFGFFKNFFRRR